MPGLNARHCSFSPNSNGIVVKNQANQVLARGCRRGDLLALKEKNKAALSVIKGKATYSNMWHKKLDTPMPNCYILSKQKGELSIPNRLFVCLISIRKKIVNIPFFSSYKILALLFDKIHRDT